MSESNQPGTGEPTPEPGPTTPPQTIDEPASAGPVAEQDPATDRDHEQHADTDTPRIWVGSWLDYNSGILHGAWIDATQDTATLHADIAAMLADSPTTPNTGEPAEDWGIFDHDNFGSLRINEQDSLSWISAVARGITKHGPAFAAYAQVVEQEQYLNGFQDTYIGHYDCVQDYADELVDDAGYAATLDRALPEGIRQYTCIDTAALARDMQLSGDIHVIPAHDGGVWLFHAE
jgi:antirestriction protein